MEHIIDKKGKVNFDPSDLNKTLAYYDLVDFFSLSFDNNKKTDNYFPDFSKKENLLKYSNIIRKYGCPELVKKLDKLTKGN